MHIHHIYSASSQTESNSQKTQRVMKLPIARVGVGSSAGLLIRAAMIFISLNIVRAIPASPLAFMGGFPVEPLDKSRFRQGADPKFCASREPRSCITAMSSAANKDLSAREKTREEELQILAKTLSLDSSSLLELLAKQRNKMDGSTEKAKHIDWLLKKQSSHTNLPAGTKGGSILRKSNGSKPNAESSAEGTSVEKQQKRARPRRPKIVTQKAAESRADAQKRQEDALKDPTLLTNVKFNERDDLHPSSKRALIDVMGLSTMTEIQAKTYAAALSGRDVLGRARTGTGKTVAFLLPAVERVLRSKQYQAGHNVGILIISPTRELAMQIGDEAEKLLTFHSEMSVQVAYGGTKKGRDTNQLQKRLPTVFVATPGRLQDLLESARIHGRKFSEIMSTTPVVVLDETDRLLDMGFRREIKKILNYLPRNNKRQTLLFSATVPKELKSIMAETMNKDYIEVDCIGDGAETTQTALRVKQSHVLIPSTNEYIQSVIKVSHHGYLPPISFCIYCLFHANSYDIPYFFPQIVQEVIKDGDGNSKAVVFFPTAKMVAFFSDIMREVVGIDVMELHSKKTQSTRNRVSGQFRDADTGLLFTSDVSARGVDYPGVSHVVQVSNGFY